MGKQRDWRTWDHATRQMQQNEELRRVLVDFLVENRVALVTHVDRVAGVVTHSIEFDRPYVAEVERAGSRHWVVKSGAD